MYIFVYTCIYIYIYICISRYGQGMAKLLGLHFRVSVFDTACGHGPRALVPKAAAVALVVHSRVFSSCPGPKLGLGWWCGVYIPLAW